ncbi:hypothetical protein AVEN_185424-1 [Araneus ventricosus]|uniref:Uncharacterized protein n=1 Tax=Araneus ventricosus TaxID=182803 RepID=A0A4Y2CHM8_ARAVE|nr:hypothetical protein AVEN_185424-1 [Araneus ventricosus]
MVNVLEECTLEEQRCVARFLSAGLPAAKLHLKIVTVLEDFTLEQQRSLVRFLSAEAAFENRDCARGVHARRAAKCCSFLDGRRTSGSKAAFENCDCAR